MKHIAFVLTLLPPLGLLLVSAAEDALSWRPFSYPIHTGASWYPRMTQLTDGTLLCGPLMTAAPWVDMTKDK